MFERAFDQAWQIVQQMGLHQRPSIGKAPAAKEIERQNLVWFLYLVDKQRIFIRGSACRFSICECTMELRASHSAAWRHEATLSHLELSCFLEDVYRYLYSPQANKLKKSVRTEHVRRLKRQLETWSIQYGSQLEAKGTTIRETPVLLQLRYAWQITKLLIASRDDECSGQSRLEIARTALQVVQTLCGGPYIFDGGLLVLERYVQIFLGVVNNAS